MPQAAVSANLKFTNHWIGIYDLNGPRCIPVKRVVKGIQPAPAGHGETGRVIVPADASTLVQVYQKAVEQRAPRAESNLGLFLLQIGKSAEAEAPLRRAVAIDERNNDPGIDADLEGLALSIDAQGRRNEAIDVLRRAVAGKDPRVAARASVKLAELDPERAEIYYRNAITAEERGSGGGSPRVAVVLYAYAQELRARKRDADAEPLLRRALRIQQAAPNPDPRVTIDVLNTLGNLLEGRRQLDEAERLVRGAMALAEAKFGPESAQLATSCTYLADILWNKKNLRDAGLLFRRAIAIDASLYGPDQPETAADIANLGMVITEAGQSVAGAALLRQALAIYENTLGPNSEEARFVKGRLSRQYE